MSGIYRDKGEQAMEEERREKARRLARYDEAIRLLRELATQPTDPQRWREKAHEARAFLAAEPKEGKVAG